MLSKVVKPDSASTLSKDCPWAAGAPVIDIVMVLRHVLVMHTCSAIYKIAALFSSLALLKLQSVSEIKFMLLFAI